MQIHNNTKTKIKNSPPLATPSPGPTIPLPKPPDDPKAQPWLSAAKLRFLELGDRFNGRTGGPWDIAEGTQLHSEKPVVDRMLRQVNQSTGMVALTANAATNVAGGLLFDLPAWVEEKIIDAGGPSFDELSINLQFATPMFPYDDIAASGLAKLAEISRYPKAWMFPANFIKGAEGLSHIAERHLLSPERLLKSFFLPGENPEILIDAARRVPAVLQEGGNYERIVHAGRIIGVDRNRREATSIYTLITDVKNRVITLFPGRPGAKSP